MTPSLLFTATQHGSFNLISPIIGRCSKKYLVGYLGIKKILQDKLDLNRIINEDETIDIPTLDKYDFFVTGTSPSSDVEYDIWKYASSTEKKSMCLLDSSKHLSYRFFKKDAWSFPDLICVADNQVKDALQAFATEKSRIIVTGSPYFDSISALKISDFEKQNIRAVRSITNKKVITFCTEYIAKMGEKERYGFDEISVLDDLVKYIDQSGKNRFRLIIRIHPNDSKEIYEKYIRSINGSVDCEIITDDIDRKLFQISDVVIGMTSLILVEAAIMGISSISYQPSKKITEVMEYRSMANIELAFTRKKLFSLMDGMFFFDDFKKTNQHVYTYANSVDKIMNLIESVLNCCKGMPCQT